MGELRTAILTLKERFGLDALEKEVLALRAQASTVAPSTTAAAPVGSATQWR